MMKQFSAHHRHTIAVWSLVQHSLSSFDTLVRHFGDCETALEPQNLVKWQQLKLHANHLKRAAEYATPAGQATFSNLLAHIQQHTDFIVTPEDPLYPAQLMPYTGKPQFYLVVVRLSLYYSHKLPWWAVVNPAHMVGKWPMTLPITSVKRILYHQWACTRH